DTPGNHWGKTIWHAYERAGVPIFEDVFREAYVYAERYLGSHNVIATTDTFRTTLSVKLKLQLEHLNLFTDELHADLLNNLYSMTIKNVAESKKVLEKLKQDGNKLGVVSNFYGNIETVLNEFQLRDLFSAVVESATEGVRKPDPRLLGICLERMEAVPEETIVVGDHLTKDIQPAKQLGCKAVWIKGEPWSDEHDKLQEVKPDLIITSLTSLL
ncbi:MAG: HAD family hydrolase, partial [Prevotella sp.]|nr:HAD family hydrolase [Prevotella sp.]